MSVVIREPRLLDMLCNKVRLRGYSRFTEKSYSDWEKRYILFHNKRNPAELSGTQRLMAELTYGAGMRISETHNLRVQDVDFSCKRILVRDGKGRKGQAGDPSRTAGRASAAPPHQNRGAVLASAVAGTCTQAPFRRPSNAPQELQIYASAYRPMPSGIVLGRSCYKVAAMFAGSKPFWGIPISTRP